jgi:hypothetical protein
LITSLSTAVAANAGDTDIKEITLTNTVLTNNFFFIMLNPPLFQHRNSIPKSSSKTANADEWSPVPVNGNKKAR